MVLTDSPDYYREIKVILAEASVAFGTNEERLKELYQTLSQTMLQSGTPGCEASAADSLIWHNEIAEYGAKFKSIPREVAEKVGKLIFFKSESEQDAYKILEMVEESQLSDLKSEFRDLVRDGINVFPAKRTLPLSEHPFFYGFFITFPALFMDNLTYEARLGLAMEDIGKQPIPNWLGTSKGFQVDRITLMRRFNGT